MRRIIKLESVPLVLGSSNHFKEIIIGVVADFGGFAGQKLRGSPAATIPGLLEAWW
jgi:hypothetical protein